MKDEIISSFTQFGNYIVSRLPSITIGLLFLIIFILIGSTLRAFVKKRLRKRLEDQLLINFTGRVTFLIFLIAGIMLFLNQVGLGGAAGGLLAGAGVSAIIVGFAFKDIGENFLAGFFLAFSRPFSIGDVIEVGDLKGNVKSLNFRNTHIRTFEGKDIFLPNAMLIKNPLINYTRDGLLRYDFTVGIDYGNDVLQAGKTIMNTLIQEERIEQKGDLEPFILLKEFGTSTINIQIFFWVNSFNFTGPIASLRTQVMHNVLKALVKDGFTLPADIIELKIYQEGHPIPVTLKNTPASSNS